MKEQENSEYPLHNNFSKRPHWIVREGLWAALLPGEKAVLGVLEDFAHYTTHVTNVTITTICKKSGCSKETVIKSIKHLQELGIVKKWHHKGRCHYQVYLSWDKIPIEAETYLREKGISPNKPERYHPRQTDGTFKPYKRQSDCIGQGDSVPNGQKPVREKRTLNRNILNRDNLNRNKELVNTEKNCINKGSDEPLKSSLKEEVRVPKLRTDYYINNDLIKVSKVFEPDIHNITDTLIYEVISLMEDEGEKAKDQADILNILKSIRKNQNEFSTRKIDTI